MARFGDGIAVGVDLTRAAEEATRQALEQLDGRDPDLGAIYDDVTGAMQRTLDDLADERRLPVLG